MGGLISYEIPLFFKHESDLAPIVYDKKLSTIVNQNNRSVSEIEHMLNENIMSVIFSYLDDESAEALALTCMTMFRIWKKTGNYHDLIYRYMPKNIIEKYEVSQLIRIFIDWKSEHYEVWRQTTNIRFEGKFEKPAIKPTTYTRFGGVNMPSLIMDCKLHPLLNVVYYHYKYIQNMTPYQLGKLYSYKEKLKEIKPKKLKFHMEDEDYHKYGNLSGVEFKKVNIEVTYKDEFDRDDQLMINKLLDPLNEQSDETKIDNLINNINDLEFKLQF